MTGQQGATVWLTGLSGGRLQQAKHTHSLTVAPHRFPASGKSTLGVALESAILQLGKRAFRLDGDNIRFGLNKDLGFSPADRVENIRRIGEVSKLFASSSTIAITAFISPYKADRDLARKLHVEAGLPFIEVFVDASLESVEKRDPKGLYKKARAGEIKGGSDLSVRTNKATETLMRLRLCTDFTGISAPYEAPESPELHIKTDSTTIDEGVQQMVRYLQEQRYI